MGGSKMVPVMSSGAKMPRPFSWSSMIERTEDKEARLTVQCKIPKNSFQQTPHITYPRTPSLWRTYVPDSCFIQPRIVEQPDPATLKKQCMYRKKLEKEKTKAMKKKSDFSLFKFVKSAKIKQKERYIWEEKLEPERLKVLIKYLASPVELEQIYAAQALGHLRIAEESVISALYNTLQESNSPSLQYEAARSLALLGCLETSVVKLLIRHLKEVSLNRREDILAAFKVSLQAWSLMPPFERYCIGSQNSLIRNLQRLVNLQDPLDNISFDAALCLGYLDQSSSLAQKTMLMCLTQKDWKKKIQALVMLIKHMGIIDAEIIKSIIDQLQHSPVYKHRADSAKLLAAIGLNTIQEEDMEEAVFNVLLVKLSEEPFLVVRQSVALAIEKLKMKKRVWEIMEKNLKDQNAEIRKQAVIALGVLGLRQKSVFFVMLEMLELDTSMDVRIQVIRAFSTLGMNNIYVRKSLRSKEQTAGILARECTKALKVLDKISMARKQSVIQSYRIY
ncbi:protein HEATR9 [Sceloporus undulatus]|uniref:protein HEATR9 n=1 Tax=Sceloporus undulatus TaxID=8520 RepID=UPI001C4AD02A|nr:protein HEATR9 [Sceloporus undulatus]